MSRMQGIQVLLPRTLRKEIDQQRALTGESISGYIRKAAEEKLHQSKKKK